MTIGLVPYQWKTDGGMTGWALPDGSVSAIDLRPLAQITDNTATGYAIAVYDGVLPDGSVELDTGNVTRDRDAWFATLGFRPEGEDAIDWAWDQLSEGRGADDSHSDHCRPIRCATPDSVEMWLGGRNVRSLSYTDKLRQAVLSRRDLDAIFDDVQAGRLPDGVHRKALKAEADRLGIDWRTLRSKSARWRSETPLNPTTVVNDPMNSGSSVALNTHDGWTTPQAAAPFTTGGGLLSIEGWATGLTMGGKYYAWHPTGLSSSNNLSEFTGAVTSVVNAGPMCRGNGTSSGYHVQRDSEYLKLHSHVSGTLTYIGDAVSPGSSPIRLRTDAIGSTIRASDNNSTWKVSVTNTAVTTGLRVGAHLMAFSTHSGQFVTATDFYARDFLTPASISTSPSSGPAAGGTAITITGTGFESNATVTVKGGSATGVTVASETSITATTPAGTVGAGDVVVTNPDSGFTGTQTSGFTYVTTTTTTSTTTTTTLASRRTTLGGRGLGSPYIGGYRPGFMRKD